MSQDWSYGSTLDFEKKIHTTTFMIESFRVLAFLNQNEQIEHSTFPGYRFKILCWTGSTTDLGHIKKTMANAGIVGCSYLILWYWVETYTIYVTQSANRSLIAKI